MFAGRTCSGEDSAEPIFAHSFGADHVTDDTQEDFTRSGLRYGMILDIVAVVGLFVGR